MENKEIKKMLENILANQVVLYQMLDQIQVKLTPGHSKSSSLSNYTKDLAKEAEKVKEYLKIID